MSSQGAPIYPQMGQSVPIMSTYPTTRVAQTRYTLQPQHQQHALPQQIQQQPVQTQQQQQTQQQHALPHQQPVQLQKATSISTTSTTTAKQCCYSANTTSRQS